VRRRFEPVLWRRAADLQITNFWFADDLLRAI